MVIRTFRRQARLAVVALVLLAPSPRASAGPARGDAPPAPRDVTLKTADNLQIAAKFWPASAAGGAGAVMLPMYASDHAAWDPVVASLRARGVAVLAIDPRGHGKSAKQGKVDLAPLVVKRDPKLFAAMHEDAIAAVRWLAKEGGCDTKRIALVGASVGGSVAIDAVSRHPNEVAAVVWMSPGVKYLGLDTLVPWKGVPAATPVLLLTHRGEIDVGAQKLVDARPATRLVVYDDAAPPDAGADRAWAHGTKMFGRLPLAELTVASFVAMATGSKTDDVVLDGIVTTEGANADAWDKAADVGRSDAEGSVRAFRVGRRLLFGGTVPAGVKGLQFEVQTGAKTEDAGGVPVLGPPQVVGVDLSKGAVAWSWGGMGSMPNFPGMDGAPLFGKTVPALRAVSSEAGTSFEGEWYVPMFGDKSDEIRLLVVFTMEPPSRPEGGMVSVDLEHSVDLPPR